MSELAAAFAQLSPAEQYALGLIAFPIFLVVIGAAIGVVLLNAAPGDRRPPTRMRR